MSATLVPELSVREHELSLLYEIASIAKHIDSQERVFELTLDKASRLLGSEIAAFYLADPATGQLEVQATRGVRASRLIGAISPAAGQFERIASSDNGWASLFNPVDRQYTLKAALSLPLRQSGQLLGWLFVGRLRRDSFDPHELALYTVLGEQASGALQMTLTWERQRRQQADLAAANARLEQMVAELSARGDEQQQLLETVRALSTPVLSIDPQVLLIPLIGLIDSGRAALIQQSMLEAISSSEARVAILDISGVAMVDEQVIKGLLQTAQASALLGAVVILCGISPEVAQMIVGLGLELHVATRHNLRAAINQAFEIVGRPGRS